MAGLLEKVNKRRCFPVKLEDREIFVRAMRSDEIARMNQLESDARTMFFIGKCLVYANGIPEIPQKGNESDIDFSNRVSEAMAAADVDMLTIGEISQAIGRVGQVNPEDLRKNSSTTEIGDLPSVSV